MKKKLLALLTTLFMGASVCALASCSSCSNTDNPPTSSSQPGDSSSGGGSSDLPEGDFAELEDFTLGFGEAKTLSVQGENLTWQSSDPRVAIVSQYGEVFGADLGEATITVSNGEETVSCKVTVERSLIAPSVAIDVSQRSLLFGKTLTIAPEISASGVVLEHANVVYESENPEIITVDANGVITAVAYGETKIFVTYNVGGHFDMFEIPVKVVEDVVLEVNQTSITLAVVEVEGGTYSSQAEIAVTQLKVNGADGNFADVTFTIDDETIATVEDGVITAKKVGETVVTATYQTQDTFITIDVPVSVVRERKEIEGKGRVDASWDAMKAKPADYAFIELPLSLQVADEDVLSIANKAGKVLSEGQGLTVPKSSLDGVEKTYAITTETLVYVVTVAVENSLIQITDYSAQFDNAMGVQATALGEMMDGRDDVVKAVSPTKGNGGVWYNHNGYVRFNLEQGRGVFMYEVKAASGTPIGGYFADGTSSYYTNFSLNTSTMKFSSPHVKVVNADFEETTFVYGKWNTVVIDFSAIGTEEFETCFMPSFTNTDVSTQYTAYYCNFRYMTKSLYEQIFNPSVEKKYTVSFDMGDSGLTFANQEISYRGRVDVPEIGDGYNFLGWAIDGYLVDLAKLHVTSDITVQAVYDKLYQYTVKHFQRQINGAYKEVESEVFEAKMAELVTATPKSYSGYTYNVSLSVTQGYVQTENKLVLACYYENDNYSFQTQMMGGHENLSINEKAMTNVPVEDLRENTYFYQKSTADGNTQNSFTYNSRDLGKYLVLNVYYTKISNQMGVVVWANTANKPTAYDTIVGYYGADGKLLTIEDDVLNNWISIVIYLNETKFMADQTSFYLSLCSWSANELYYGEYTVLTKNQLNGYFEQVPTMESLPTGVTGYQGSTLERSSTNNINCLTDAFNGRKTFITKDYHFSSCGIAVEGLTAWTANQYVAVRVYSDSISGKHLLEDAYMGEQVAVYDDEGNVVEAENIKASTWYTYVYKPGAQAIGQYSGCFLVNVANEVGIKIIFDSIYVMENEAAYNNFKTWKGWNA